MREGGELSIWENPVTHRRTSVPRHNEILEFTVARICKQLGGPCARVMAWAPQELEEWSRSWVLTAGLGAHSQPNQILGPTPNSFRSCVAPASSRA